MFDLTIEPSDGEPDKEEVRRVVLECKLEIIEHYNLDTQQDGISLMIPSVKSDATLLQKYMLAYSFIYTDGLRTLKQLFTKQHHKLITDLVHEWIPFPNFHS